MIIYLISGDGSESGKTTLAEKLVGKSRVWSIASGLRSELQRKYPQYNWYSKDQAVKDHLVIKEYGDGRKTMRQVMVEYGQAACQENPCYWVEKLAESLDIARHMPTQGALAIDDVRKVCELSLLKEMFPQAVHMHVVNPDAKREPQYDNIDLKHLANYVVDWDFA